MNKYLVYAIKLSILALAALTIGYAVFVFLHV